MTSSPHFYKPSIFMLKLKDEGDLGEKVRRRLFSRSSSFFACP